MSYPSSSAVVTAIFSDSACFLDIGSLLKEAFIGNAVTGMLGVQQLSQLEMLLSLDNCECLYDACRDRCTGVLALAYSRHQPRGH